MNQQGIEELLKLNENDGLDFKRNIDLETKRGQADFFVEMLGLANTDEKPTYLILGVEDNPRKVTGVDASITEERLQKFVNDNLRNPLQFIYEVYPYKRKKIGVISIFGRKRPYVLKKALSYQDNNGKQHHISDKQVQVRRGSTGDIATIEEVLEMATEHVDNSDIAGELSDISSSIYKLGGTIGRQNNDRDRSIEYIFAGIVSSVVITLLLLFGWQSLLLIVVPIPFMINIILSALKVVNFGLLRSIGVGIIISTVFLFLTGLDGYISQYITNAGPTMLAFVFWGSIKGVIGGLVADYFIGRAEL